MIKSWPNILYEILCHHGRMNIQISDQGRGFENEVSKELHRRAESDICLPSPGKWAL